MGRTTLVEYFKTIVSEPSRNCFMFSVVASAADRNTPWSCMKAIVAQILDTRSMGLAEEAESKTTLVEAFEEHKPELVPYLPLFNAFAPFNFQENDDTSFLSAAGRAEVRFPVDSLYRAPTSSCSSPCKYCWCSSTWR